jgi:hypothetical protein
VERLAERHGREPYRVAAIIAALSPQVRWRENVYSADALLAGDKSVRGYPANIAKAWAIREGAEPAQVLGGDKVLAFWANLGGATRPVTIDTWAARAAEGLERPRPNQPKHALYKRFARAYTAAADYLQIPPRDFQAIVWLATRPASEFQKDTEAIYV